MGANRPLTFGPDEMTRLKQIVLNAEFTNKAGGAYQFHENFPARYIADLTQTHQTQAQAQGRGGLRQWHCGGVRAAGDGSDRLRGNPARHRARLHLPEIQSQSRRHGNAARHPRCGAASTRPMSASASTATATAAAWSTTPARKSSPTRSASCWRATCRLSTANAQFVVDVKSTGLFVTDPVLQKQGAKADLLEDRPFLHEAPHQRTRRAGRLREIRPFLLQHAARPRL